MEAPTGSRRSQYTTRYVAVTTNPANGKWFTLTQSSMFQERGLTDLGGGLWGYSVNQAGQPFVITDSTGRVVVRDRGLIQFDGVYDANTDQVTSFELRGMAGRTRATRPTCATSPATSSADLPAT